MNWLRNWVMKRQYYASVIWTKSTLRVSGISAMTVIRQFLKGHEHANTACGSILRSPEKIKEKQCCKGLQVLGKGVPGSS